MKLSEFEKLMEEMAGVDKSQYGVRRSGERCAYEMYK